MAKQQIYDPNFTGPINNIKKLLNGKLIYLRSNKDPISGVQSLTYFPQKKGETANQFYKRIAVLRDEGIKAARALDVLPIKELNKNIGNWSDKWFKENFKKDSYKPREVDKFLKNLKKDWAKEVKEKGYKKAGALDPSKGGYPNLFKRVDQYKVGSYPLNNNLEKGERNFRKAFFENQLKTNPKFKSELDNYFSYFIENKSGKANQYMTATPPAAVKDAVYWLSDDSGIKGVSRTNMFAKIPSLKKTFDTYQQKFSKTGSALKNKNLIEKELGLRKNTIQRLQNKEGAALKELFGVTNLPPELAYSVDHTQGLAVAARSGSKRMMKTAISDLAGMTTAENSRLGWAPGTFELTRKRSVNKIQEGLKNGKNMSREVNELNKFIFDEYGKNISKNKKPYSIVGNKLKTGLISEAKNQNQRFGQYFNELASKPESSQILLEQINTRPNLTKFVQEGTDPILTSLRSNVIKLAKNNTDNFCNILSMRKADGGRMGFATGGNCATQVAAKFDEDPFKFAQDVNKIPEQPGIINQAKSFASKFLSVAKKGGRFGAFAAAGAATAGLVKEFRNDDPSTYLSNEDQQKNMLIDMLTQPVSAHWIRGQPSTAFGDAQLPAIGAVTAAGMVPGGAELYRQRTGSGVMKGPLGGPRLDAEGAKIFKNRVSPARALLGPLSGVLGKGLAATGTPLGMAVLEPLYIGQQIADGDSAGEIATNPMNYLGPAFAGSLSKEATRFVGPKMANIMRLGISPMALKTVSRRFGLPGLALSAGISGYEMYQNKKAGRGIFDDG
jgi:hypothetical protein